ncbi:MAG: lysophospholipid acyltransferase family protein, partial [Gaiellaceae bacterium]
MRAFLYEDFGEPLIKPLTRAIYRVEIAGAERVPRSGPCVLVSNHESVIDPFVLALVTRRTVRYMAKAELWDHPVMRFFMEAFGTFPIQRRTGDRGAVDRAAQLLDAGEIIGIFPQGTTLPYRRKPWGRGAAKLALATGAPIVPACLVGTERAVRPHRLKLGLPRLLVLVGQPIRVDRQRPTVANAKALTERVADAIGELRRPYGPPAHVWI